jgi:hypothetical protein
MEKYDIGLNVLEDTGTLVDNNSKVEREKTQSSISWPKDVNNLSAICLIVSFSSAYIKESTYFKRVKNDIKLDRILSSDRMVNLARVRQRCQNNDRYNN